MSLSPRVDNPAHVIAKVNGIPILEQDLVPLMKDGQGQGAALQQLVARELLAQEAHRRGYSKSPRVLQEQKRAMATALIESFETKYTIADVPRGMIKAAYKKNKLLYVRPELVTVALITVAATKRNTDEFHRRALRIAREIRATAASGPLSPKEFRGLAAFFAKKNPAVTITPDTRTTQRRGYLVPSVADAAFALSVSGEISPVVQSRFGYHVLYFKERHPAKNLSLEQVEQEIRDRVFQQAKAQAFHLWTEELKKKYGASVEKSVPKAAFGRPDES
jgi:peptidyl-prolyl cis-trans isomerase C